MTIRVGECWQARNGHRRWISLPLHDLLFAWGAWAVFVLPFLFLWWLLLAELWVAAECAVFAVHRHPGCPHAGHRGSRVRGRHLVAAAVGAVRSTKISSYPPKPPKMREIVRWIAMLGGFLGRKGDGEPGVITLWRGWKRLFDLSEGWNLARGQSTCG